MTLDDRLDVIAERSFIVNCHSEYDKDATKSDKDYYKAKQAILSDLLEIIGETEIQVRGITQNKENPMYWTKGTKIDYELRQELREKVKKYCE